MVCSLREGNRLLMDNNIYIYSHNSPTASAPARAERGPMTRSKVNVRLPSVWHWPLAPEASRVPFAPFLCNPTNSNQIKPVHLSSDAGHGYDRPAQPCELYFPVPANLVPMAVGQTSHFCQSPIPDTHTLMSRFRPGQKSMLIALNQTKSNCLGLSVSNRAALDLIIPYLIANVP